jgi:hypothetical protein
MTRSLTVWDTYNLIGKVNVVSRPGVVGPRLVCQIEFARSGRRRWEHLPDVAHSHSQGVRTTRPDLRRDAQGADLARPAVV